MNTLDSNISSNENQTSTEPICEYKELCGEQEKNSNCYLLGDKACGTYYDILNSKGANKK